MLGRLPRVGVCPVKTCTWSGALVSLDRRVLHQSLVALAQFSYRLDASTSAYSTERVAHFVTVSLHLAGHARPTLLLCLAKDRIILPSSQRAKSHPTKISMRGDATSLRSYI